MPGFVATKIFRVVGYDVWGNATEQLTIAASDAFDARDIAEQQSRNVDVDEYQTVARIRSNAEIIAEDYTPISGAIICATCNELTETSYADVVGDDRICLACVHSALDHGRKHVSEAFDEELLPWCNYCQTSGHRAHDCPERPDDDGAM